mmetsp:Transcript_128788/g.287005  ORF Transcript_128788/g.287005 Transcript_128788/m.287005 type:complete len:215 (-) Transcript_128788:1285-1929(-)
MPGNGHAAACLPLGSVCSDDEVCCPLARPGAAPRASGQALCRASGEATTHVCVAALVVSARGDAKAKSTSLLRWWWWWPLRVAHSGEPPVRIAKRLLAVQPTVRILLDDDVRQAPTTAENFGRMPCLELAQRRCLRIARQTVDEGHQGLTLCLKSISQSAHIAHGVGVLDLRHIEDVAVSPIRAVLAHDARIGLVVGCGHRVRPGHDGHEHSPR